MGRLRDEGRAAMAVLLEQEHSQRVVARPLGVSERAVRYYRKRWSTGSVDGPSKQALKAAAHEEAISV